MKHSSIFGTREFIKEVSHLSDVIVVIVQAFPAHFSRDEIEIINAESSESADTADKDWVHKLVKVIRLLSEKDRPGPGCRFF